MLDLKKSLVSVEYAQKAYLDQLDIEKLLEEQNIYLQTFERGDIRAIVGVDDDIMTVAFKGTNPTHLLDWIADFDVRLVDTPSGIGRVTGGVLKSYSKIGSELEEFILDAASKHKIRIAGHSLGGNLATYFASRLMDLGVDWELLETFGSPRTGDKTFAQRFQPYIHKANRWVNGADIVPRFPTREMGCSHIDDATFIDHQGDIHSDKEGLSFWEIEKERVVIRVQDAHRGIFLSGIHNHMLERYAEAIKAGMMA